jgi:hypothetical protein
MFSHAHRKSFMISSKLRLDGFEETALTPQLLALTKSVRAVGLNRTRAGIVAAMIELRDFVGRISDNTADFDALTDAYPEPNRAAFLLRTKQAQSIK